MKNYTLIYICENDLSVPIGGTIHVREVLDSLAHLHPDLYAIVPAYTTRPLFISPQIRRITLPTPHIRIVNWLWFYMRSCLTILHLLVIKKRLVIYAREMPFNLLLAGITRLLDIPLIIEVNSSLTSEVNALNRRLIERWLTAFSQRIIFRAANRIVAVSVTLKADLMRHFGLAKEKITIIYNGVRPHPTDTATQSINLGTRFGEGTYFMVGFIGSCYPYHDLDSLIRVAPQIINTYPDTRFFIGGDGAVLAMWQDQIRKRDLVEYFHLAGYIDPNAVPATINAFDCCISLYKRDVKGPGMKIFDYLLCNKPVIASAQAESRQIFGQFANICWTKIENPRSVFDAIVNIRRNYNHFKNFDSRTLILDQFTWDHTAHNIIETIEKTLCAA